MSEVEVVADVDWQFAECARACGEITRYRIASPFWRFFQGALIVLVVGVLALTTIVGLISDVDTATYLFTQLPWVLILLVFLALRFGGTGWLTAWGIRRNNPNMLAGMRHSISSAAYQVRAGQVESTAHWPGILRVVETKGFFLTFPMKSAAYYLPKRVLTQEQCLAIRSVVQQQAADRFIQRAR